MGILGGQFMIQTLAFIFFLGFFFCKILGVYVSVMCIMYHLYAWYPQKTGERVRASESGVQIVVSHQIAVFSGRAAIAPIC